MSTTDFERIARLGTRFYEEFGAGAAPRYFSAPGRAEIGGNHTDHQRGRVLAAAIDLDTLAAVRANGTPVVNLHSEGFPQLAVDLSDLAPSISERGTMAALVRGCAAGIVARGRSIGGFDAVATSQVLVGSGLSSSAAFEILLIAIMDHLFGAGDLTAPQRAVIAQQAENLYFGKPSGLMDQMASSVGGLVAIDFEKEDALIEPIAYDFEAHGYTLAIVDTGGSHDQLTHAYAAIRTEMEAVAQRFGKTVLREVDPQAFYDALPTLYSTLSDRALLRAMHFFGENERVLQEVEALRLDDLPRFLQLVNASGQSSYDLLQNIAVGTDHQPIALALALAKRVLMGEGACRIHGGGFAGTILAFVPVERMDAFRKSLESVFGPGTCHALNTRPFGAVAITV